MVSRFLTTSIPDAGRQLGMARSPAYRAADRGEIKTVKFGKLRRVPLPWLRRMLAQKRKEERLLARRRKPAAAESTPVSAAEAS